MKCNFNESRVSKAIVKRRTNDVFKLFHVNVPNKKEDKIHVKYAV